MVSEGSRQNLDNLLGESADLRWLFVTRRPKGEVAIQEEVSKQQGRRYWVVPTFEVPARRFGYIRVRCQTASSAEAAVIDSTQVKVGWYRGDELTARYFYPTKRDRREMPIEKVEEMTRRGLSLMKDFIGRSRLGPDYARAIEHRVTDTFNPAAFLDRGPLRLLSAEDELSAMLRLLRDFDHDRLQFSEATSLRTLDRY